MLAQYLGAAAILVAATLGSEHGLFRSHATEAFAYCSDGKCGLATPQTFQTSLGLPLDTRFTCSAETMYAMTFDDGPSANYEALLAILERHQVKATFFVVGYNLESEDGQRRLRLAYQAGHMIANHTYGHADLSKLGPAEVLDQVERGRQLIIDTLGDSPDVLAASRIVRPPYGRINEAAQEVLRQHGYVTVRWNGDRYDWQHDDGEKAVQRVIQQLEFIKGLKAAGEVFNPSILDLNHDRKSATPAAMERAIPYIKEAGYEFVRLDRCLKLDMTTLGAL